MLEKKIITFVKSFKTGALSFDITMFCTVFRDFRSSIYDPRKITQVFINKSFVSYAGIYCDWGFSLLFLYVSVPAFANLIHIHVCCY